MNINDQTPAPRYCSVTYEPMFEGWCVQDGESYLKYESDAIKCAKAAGYADLEEAFLDDFMYYTDWTNIPEDEWDESPLKDVLTEKIIMRLKYVEETYAGELETWLDPETGTHYRVPITTQRDWDNAKSLKS